MSKSSSVIFSFRNIVIREQERMKKVKNTAFFTEAYQDLFLNKNPENNANNLQSTSIGERYFSRTALDLGP